MNVEQEILSLERRALDRWCKGDPLGYLEIDSDDVTYFDDIGAQDRVDGVQAMRAYMSSLEGKIPPHRYELLNPKVQLYDETAVLTMRYSPRTEDGSALPEWKATSVYRRVGDEWQIVHAHWSTVKAP